MYPHTLDLTEHARLAIRHMTANFDRRNGFPYFYVNLAAPVPHAAHDAWDVVDQLSRYVDSLILTRAMTGDNHGMDTEERYRSLLLASFRPEDGLAYRAVTPWSRYEAGMFDQSRALNGMVTWYMAEKDEEIRRVTDRLVQGLWDTAIHIVRERPGYVFCYHPYASRLPEGWDPMYPGEPCCYGGGSLILPLVKWTEVTGSERALEMARRLTRYIVHESGVFRPDGSFWPDQMLPEHGHFHTRSLTMAGILRYALLTGEAELVDWVRRAYDWAMATFCGSFGWFPEGVGTTDRQTTRHSETCNITDMLHISLKLAEAGHPEHWTRAERFVRNHLIESQWTRTDHLPRPTEAVPDDTNTFTYHDMDERIVGGFAGRTLPWEFVVDGVMMGCCCGAGARALFLAWQSILTRRSDGLYVNLHLNRFSHEADVLSWLPYEGRVDVLPHAAGPLYIRLPDAPLERITVTRNGAPCPFTVANGYLRVDASAEDTYTLRFPVTTEEREEKLLDWHLRLRWRGDTVLTMEPSGSRFPLYQRATLEGETAPMRERTPERRDTDLQF